MATARRFKHIADTLPEGVTWPSREELEDGLRHARRTVKDVRHAAEDAIDDAAVTIRRHPFAAVGAAAAAGVLVGATAVGVAALVRRLKTGSCCA